MFNKKTSNHHCLVHPCLIDGENTLIYERGLKQAYRVLFIKYKATGILIDKQGNDEYQATTAACQGAAWDVALGLLIDMQGNDQYMGETLCQGTAAMQAQAWLIDLDGEDNYFATSSSTQGRSGNNTYHFDQSKPVYSWSLLLDAGGQKDNYSSKQMNDSINTTADYNYEEPGKTRAHGMFIDTSKILKSLN